MMVSSLFLPAACRCVLSPLYPVPTLSLIHIWHAHGGGPFRDGVQHHGEKVPAKPPRHPCDDMDQIHVADPVSMELCRLRGEIDVYKRQEHTGRLPEGKGRTPS